MRSPFRVCMACSNVENALLESRSLRSNPRCLTTTVSPVAELPNVGRSLRCPWCRCEWCWTRPQRLDCRYRQRCVLAATWWSPPTVLPGALRSASCGIGHARLGPGRRVRMHRADREAFTAGQWTLSEPSATARSFSGAADHCAAGPFTVVPKRESLAVE